MRFKELFENDDEHQDALNTTGFWGKQAAGCLFLAKSTGRILFPLRSGEVEQPGTWGTWGGAIDANEAPADAVRREAQEEAGYPGPLELLPMIVFSHPNGFRYHNFLAVIDDEFEPELNWESDSYKWVEFGKWPKPLHPGAKYLLQNSGAAIEQAVAKYKLGSK